MPRDLTPSEKLAESIRCDQAMVEHWEKRTQPEWLAEIRERNRREIELLQRRIDTHTKHIAEAEAEVSFAAEKLEEYRRRVSRQRDELRLLQNQGGVDRLQKLASRAAEMIAELERAAAADPTGAAAEALRALRAGTL
jgi:hypothetical protein